MGLALSQQYQKHRSSLEFSLAKLASGDRMALPGRNPAELSISERMKAQVSSQEMGIQNIQTNISLINTSGDYLNSLNDILLKMTEITSAATMIPLKGVSPGDTNPDLINIDKEYQILKQEFSYLTRESNFNEKQVIGQDYMLSYDSPENKLRYWTSTGTDETIIQQDFSETATDATGAELKFDPTLSFTMGPEGKDLYYIGKPTSTTFDVRRFSLDSHTMEVLSSGGDSSTVFRTAADSSIVVDELGMVYVSGIGSLKNIYSINPKTLERKSHLPSVNTAGASFSVYDNTITYINIDGVVNTYNINTSTPTNTGLDLKNSSSNTYKTAFQSASSAFSNTGKYIADIADTGVIRIYNTEQVTGATITLSGAPDISDISFNADENRIYYINKTSSTLGYVAVDVDLDGSISLSEGGNVVQGKNPTTLIGLGMGGMSPASQGKLGVGFQENPIEYELADARMWKLGLLPTNLRTRDDATTTLETLQEAMQKLSFEKTKVSAHALTMEMGIPAMKSYISDLSSVVSRIRNVDVAKATMEVTYEQMRTQAAMAVLGKFNQVAMSAMQLLNSI